MSFNQLKTVTVVLFALASSTTFAQKRWNQIDTHDATSVDTLKKRNYTLVFIDKSPDLNPTLKQRLIDAFFSVYPKEAKKYNKNTIKKVIFVVDPEYKGVAATGNGIVRYNPEWFKKNPGDIDVVTHEVMHLVQAYPNDAGPGWITEGIADYVRFTMGIDNAGANWTLPDYAATQSYENAYRVTARFLYWIEQKVKKGTVKKLDRAMRTKTYTADFWKQTTGKSVDELWQNYAQDPEIS